MVKFNEEDDFHVLERNTPRRTLRVGYELTDPRKAHSQGREGGMSEAPSRGPEAPSTGPEAPSGGPEAPSPRGRLLSLGINPILSDSPAVQGTP